MRILAPVIAATLMLGACGSTRYEFQPAAAGEPEARIPFAAMSGTVRDWHADTDTQLFVQANGRQWYQVDLFGPCYGLEYANGIVFDTKDPSGAFDRFSAIVLGGGQRCQVL